MDRLEENINTLIKTRKSVLISARTAELCGDFLTQNPSIDYSTIPTEYFYKIVMATIGIIFS